MTGVTVDNASVSADVRLADGDRHMHGDVHMLPNLLPRAADGTCFLFLKHEVFCIVFHAIRLVSNDIKMEEEVSRLQLPCSNTSAN